MLAIVCLAALALIWWAMAEMNKKHRDETGVNMPTRAAMKRIRRTSRQKGITQEAAYDSWVKTKQRRKRT